MASDKIVGYKMVEYKNVGGEMSGILRGQIFLRVLAVQYDCYLSVQKSSRACALAKRPPSGRAWSERTAIASYTRSWSDAGRNNLPNDRRSLTSAKTSGASPSECDVRASQLRRSVHSISYA